MSRRDRERSAAYAEALKYAEMRKAEAAAKSGQYTYSNADDARGMTMAQMMANMAEFAAHGATGDKHPWFTSETGAFNQPPKETKDMSGHKFKFDPAKVAEIFGAEAAEAKEAEAKDKTSEKPKRPPLEIGQVWKTRAGAQSIIGRANTDASYDQFLGTAEHAGPHEMKFKDGSVKNAKSWWYVNGTTHPGFEDAYGVNGDRPHPDDLVELITHADGTPAKKEDEKPQEAKAKRKKQSEYPAGSLDARVLELIDKHGVPEDKLREIMAELGVKSSTITIKIPDIKVEHTTENQHEQFPTLLELIANGERVFLSGPPGSGKTTATEKAAEILKRPFFIQGPVADEFRLTGFIDAHGQFQETEVYRWATTPDAILMLDEVDGSFPQPLLFLNMALANGYIAFPGKGKVMIPKTNTVVANGNTWGGGADFDFVGRSKLDAAFVNRFPAKLSWDYDHKFEESLAIGSNGGKKEWVKVMWKIRENARKNGIKVHVTPRDTFFYCRSRARGWTHEKALATGLLATCKKDQQEKLLAGVTCE